MQIVDTDYPWYKYAYFTFSGRQYLAEMIDINGQRLGVDPVTHEEVVVLPVLPQYNPIEVNIYLCEKEGQPEAQSLYRKRYVSFSNETLLAAIQDYGRRNTNIF